ncbi:hypothetical protein PG994_007866 [Apiospora phragmitis]|uniref:Uncharacterized protein n=1 Tax=Apiospora phragmitis TaxID=2905665 RepID=A0ABR1URF1_9PEZI
MGGSGAGQPSNGNNGGSMGGNGNGQGMFPVGGGQGANAAVNQANTGKSSGLFLVPHWYYQQQLTRVATGWKHPLFRMLDSNATPGWKAPEATSDLPLSNMVGPSAGSLWAFIRLNGKAIADTAQHAEVSIETDQAVLGLLMSVSFLYPDTRSASSVHLTCLDRSDGDCVVGRGI